ncbi:hypothetical protein MRB53_006229 [Persea americana]|uniref:Uncharacterized protein n=1 Tax=Persea americana TaxID=3435 RepID=A0ACC2MGK4_PERAE|nr:hypothetical protein MRB53_006229 [Persea americana]
MNHSNHAKSYSDMSSQEATVCRHKDGIRVTVTYTLKETKSWLVPAIHEGRVGFYLHQIDMPDSIVHFSACIYHLLSQEGSERFVLDTVSLMDDNQSVSVQELAPRVYEAAQNALKTGCSCSVDSLLEMNTYEYWPLPDTSGGGEWESLNEERQDFGAVPATDYEIMMALRTKVFEKEMHHSSKYDCPICLEEFLDDTEVYQLPCQHFFHGACIVKWLRRSSCCPYCRFRLQRVS